MIESNCVRCNKPLTFEEGQLGDFCNGCWPTIKQEREAIEIEKAQVEAWIQKDFNRHFDGSNDGD